MAAQQARAGQAQAGACAVALQRSERVGAQAIEAGGVLQHRRVAALAHVGQDLGHAAFDGRVRLGRPMAQALELDGARSIITLPATRRHKGETRSNIVWSYGHETIPRHLRDMVVTEYGVADLRGQSDEQVIQRLIAIADSRFHGELLEKARSAGKIAPDWDIPEAHRDNLPERIGAAMPIETFPSFPFGTDFTQIEQQLLPAMQ